MNTTIKHIISALFAILAIRLGVDYIFQSDIGSLTLRSFYYEALHTGLFFAWNFLIIGLIFAFFTQKSWTFTYKQLLYVYPLIALPPILDRLISHHLLDDMRFFSYYLYASPADLLWAYVTFFGPDPHDGITYGTRIMVAFALFYCTFFVWRHTKSILRTFLAVVAIYTAFFIMSSTPSLLTYIMQPVETSFGRVDEVDVAQLFTSKTNILSNISPTNITATNRKMNLFYIIFLLVTLLGMMLVHDRKKLFTIIRHLRPLQMIYHCGLVLFGMMLASIFVGGVVILDAFSVVALCLLLFTVICAWSSTVFFNDIADIKIDTITLKNRPLPQKLITIETYKSLGLITMIFSLLALPLISPQSTLLLALYFALAWIYNTPPMRLKRFPFIGTAIAALASLMIILLGFVTISPSHNLENFPLRIGGLLLFGLSFALILKDFRDIKGDKKNSVITVPVLIGETKARLLVAAGIFISFLFAANLFGRETSLISIATGITCYALITYKRNDEFLIKSKDLVSTIFLVMLLFVAISVWLLFLKV